MKAFDTPIRNYRALTQSARSGLVRITLVSLFIFLFGLLASAQELSCEMSFRGDWPNVSVQATSHHSQHCIRHQEPLPGFDSAPQTISGPSIGLARIVVGNLLDYSTTNRAHTTLYTHDVQPHAGVSIYKLFAHFLI